MYQKILDLREFPFNNNIQTYANFISPKFLEGIALQTVDILFLRASAPEGRLTAGVATHP